MGPTCHTGPDLKSEEIRESEVETWYVRHVIMVMCIHPRTFLKVNVLYVKISLTDYKTDRDFLVQLLPNVVLVYVLCRKDCGLLYQIVNITLYTGVRGTP